MATDEVERLHYYERQFLGATDFEAAQTYQRNMRRRHSLGHHTLGIVVGLELVERPAEGDANAVDVFVQPGLAIDGYGREILVLAPRRLEVPEFERFSDLRDREVWIRYREELGQRPQAGFEQCDEVDQFGRVRESFAIEVEPRPPRHDRVMIAGRDAIASTDATPATPEDTPRIPSDESVPHQDFVDDQGHRYWPIRLGTVSWDGVNRKFRKADDRLAQGRQYVSVVAQTVLAPAGSVRIVDRSKYTPFDPAKEKDFLAAVEGTLRVDGLLTARDGVQLDGHRLDLRDVGGSADSRVEIYRQTGLRISLGEPDKGNRFAIGIGIDPVFDEKLGMNDKGDLITKGSLDVSGTVKLNSRLEIRDPGDPDSIWIERLKNQQNAADLRLVIGNSESGQNRLVVGPIPLGTTDIAAKLTVASNGDTTIAKDLDVSGTVRLNKRIEIRDQVGGIDTDILWIERFRNQPNRNDLRVVIGDDQWGDDRFVVGPIPYGTATLVEKFVVANTGDAQIARDLRIGRDLKVTGNQNIIRVKTETFRKMNAGKDTPGDWEFTYPLALGEQFTEVYDVFAMLHGFSIWANNDRPQFNRWNHVPGLDVIPQHVFVRVDGHDLTHAWGQHYASQSDADQEWNNTVLFTVVVIGRVSV